MIDDPHKKAFPDKQPHPYVVIAQTRLETMWEVLMTVGAGTCWQLFCDECLFPYTHKPLMFRR